MTNKVNKLFSVSITILAILTILSCMGKDGVSGQDGRDGKDGRDGMDGEDGRAAIAYSWLGNIWGVWSTDPMIPQTFYNGTYYYYATTGTYSYGYSGDGGSWTGYYTIYIDEGKPGWSGTPGRPGMPGEPGEPGDWFWQDGEDGADGADGADGIDGIDGMDGWDMCFELYLFSYIGPSFYEWICSFMGIELPKIVINPNETTNNKYMDDVNNELENYQNYSDLEIKEELEQINVSTVNEMDIIKRLDSDPKTVVESGKIGKYHFIHKSLKED